MSRAKKVPDDEMLLAEMIAAAMARGMGWVAGAPFVDRIGSPTGLRDAVRCCALGAAVLAGRATRHRVIPKLKQYPTWNRVHIGNDRSLKWGYCDSDRGESLGWAFRQAMQEDS